ncbi:type II secretion system protein GspG [Gammaproteobacteria bacterium LSUCC0112]|nr:type II secretion system protein GspG [Gammaproteobacteria bacterium LSUCC0112]
MNKQTKGFSLIEILVVLVIMGLLVSIIAPNVLGRADEARVQKVFADFSAIETALRLYRLDNYAYPSSEQGLSALQERPTLAPVPANWRTGGYLEDLPIDPWGNPYLYLSPGQQGDYDIFSYGADGVRGGEGQNTDYGNWQDNAQQE